MILNVLYANIFFKIILIHSEKAIQSLGNTIVSKCFQIIWKLQIFKNENVPPDWKIKNEWEKNKEVPPGWKSKDELEKIWKYASWLEMWYNLKTDIWTSNHVKWMIGVEVVDWITGTWGCICISPHIGYRLLQFTTNYHALVILGRVWSSQRVVTFCTGSAYQTGKFQF